MTFLAECRMRPHPNLIKILFLISFLTACNENTSKVTKQKLFVFGTVVEISIWSENSTNIQHAINEISTTFNTMHHQWHAWKPGRLTDINQALRSGKKITLNQAESAFIQQTIKLSKQSNHLFNPAVGELINLWGFHSDEFPLLTPPPTAKKIEILAAKNITTENLNLDGLNLSSDHPNIWLDFGGIAKGYAIDIAIQILKKHQINHAIINAGGDIRSIGNKGGSDIENRPWQVAIQSPTDWSMLAQIQIDGDESVFTSGNYHRFKKFDGKRYSHIINPHNGQPVEFIISATVIAADGITADAAATALVVAGEQWPQIAKLMNIDQALIINEQLQCFGTKAMINRLQNQTIDCQSLD